MKWSDDRLVLHLDLDTFFVSVERLRDRRLEGRPVIVGGMGDRAVVSSCSYEARAMGVRSAMSIRAARQLCPHAVFLSGDMDAYSRYSKMVTEIVASRAPLFEKASVDEFYLDLSGMDRYFGCMRWSTELRDYLLKESGLPVSFGLSVNKMLSKVATADAKPNGRCFVERGTEQSFLDPKPVSRIPMVGEKTAQQLRNMGVSRILMLRQVPLRMLEGLFGKPGITLWKRAHALDDSPVEPYSEAKSLGTEQTFESDTTDVRWLRDLILAMTEKLAFELRSSAKLCSCITLRLRYANFDTVSRQASIPYTSSTRKLREKVLELFERLYDRRLLVRLAGVRLSGLVSGYCQLDLFENTQEESSLNHAIDAVKKKYGNGKLIQANGLNLSRQGTAGLPEQDARALLRKGMPPFGPFEIRQDE
jgi:DNA polymerase-4